MTHRISIDIEIEEKDDMPAVLHWFIRYPKISPKIWYYVEEDTQGDLAKQAGDTLESLISDLIYDSDSPDVPEWLAWRNE